jgi:hypothetical protein
MGWTKTNVQTGYETENEVTGIFPLSVRIDRWHDA